MAEAATFARVEPHIGPTPVSAMATEELRAAVESPVSAQAYAEAPADEASFEARSPRSALDQLSRIEDKTARIEEKYARSEALLQRVGSTVEIATGRMNEVASQAELAALRSELSVIASQVRQLPGKTAFVAVAVVTSLLTAAMVLLIIRYGLPR